MQASSEGGHITVGERHRGGLPQDTASWLQAAPLAQAVFPSGHI
jgi:hypothetical protein